MPSENEDNAESIISRRGVYYQSFAIYKEVSGFYDYGAVGLRIRRNIERAWRRIFVDELGGLEIETTTIVPEVVLKASGHVSAFNDPIINCGSCGSAYRADKLLEAYYEKRGDKESANKVKKMAKTELEEKINEFKIACEKCGGRFLKIEDFNLMFKTQIGHNAEDVGYLRPETAQGIFVDFRDLFRRYGLKLPAIICQAGKVYRNEISPRQHLVRLREFNQMEAELFFDPESVDNSINGFDTDSVLDTKINFVGAGAKGPVSRSLKELMASGVIPNKHFALVLYCEKKLLGMIGMDESLYRFRELEKEELPHYSKGNVDLEINTSYGYIEAAGNAYRTDYDLKQHSKSSGTEISVVNEGRKLIPHVVEASIGLDRTLFALIDNAVEKGEKRGWPWLRLREDISPYKYAVFPLQKDERLIKKANGIFRNLISSGVPSYCTETGSIGKRYAKADEIGVRFAITCDYQTLEDNTVTVRDRDTAEQKRIKIADIA